MTAATRREFLMGAAAASAALAAGGAGAPAGEAEAEGLVDANVDLGRWPLRRLAGDDPERMAEGLRARGVRQAWAGSIEGLLHRDLGAVNARLAEDCRRAGGGLLLPFGSIHPGAPDWEEDLRRCAEVHRFRGLRLHPNYHGYRLDDPALARLVALAAERRLIVQISLAMEDERMMHPRLRVEPVDPAPLAALVRRTPGLRLVLINALRILGGDALRSVVSAGDVWVEISMLEGVGGLERLLETVSAGRILFGSHAPIFYFESAALKLRESAPSPAVRRAIERGNAEALLA